MSAILYLVILFAGLMVALAITKTESLSREKDPEMLRREAQFFKVQLSILLVLGTGVVAISTFIPDPTLCAILGGGLALAVVWM